MDWQVSRESAPMPECCDLAVISLRVPRSQPDDADSSLTLTMGSRMLDMLKTTLARDMHLRKVNS